MQATRRFALRGKVPVRARQLDDAQTFGEAKKKRAWSPLKTTRYGVSARRPLEESTTGAIDADHDSSRDAPWKSFDACVDRPWNVSADTTTRPHPC
ncbi:hypothetical protein PSAB6_70493 [Paraburkholderia sabiae]|nr:hypothetical protein PSAB6_70493 [Paraburkholderia sabiae]